MTFRTTFLETCGSRQISLIGFFRTKTPGESWRSFPQPAFQSRPPKIQEAIVDPQPRGPDWMQITPKAGSLFHAYSQQCLRHKQCQTNMKRVSKTVETVKIE